MPALVSSKILKNKDKIIFAGKKEKVSLVTDREIFLDSGLRIENDGRKIQKFRNNSKDIYGFLYKGKTTGRYLQVGDWYIAESQEYPLEILEIKNDESYFGYLYIITRIGAESIKKEDRFDVYEKL